MPLLAGSNSIPNVVFCQVLDNTHPVWTTDLVGAAVDATPAARFDFLTPQRLDLPAAVRVITLPEKAAGGRLAARLTYVRRMRQADVHARRTGASRLIFLDFEAASASMFLLTRRGGPPLGLFLHNHVQRADSRRLERQFWRLSIAPAVRSGRAVVVPHTKTERAKVGELFGLAESAVPVVPFALHRFDLASPDQSRGMLVVGPARGDKDPVYVAELISRVARDPRGLLDRAPMTVAGTGWRQFLPADVASRVQLIDHHLSQADFELLVKRHRFVLVPYGPAHTYSGSGVLHDALGCDRPVLTSDLPVLRDIVTRYSDVDVGRLFATPDDFVETYSWAADLPDDPWRQMTDQCREYARRLRGDVRHALADLVRPPS